jgi:hypothetical protein
VSDPSLDPVVSVVAVSVTTALSPPTAVSLATPVSLASALLESPTDSPWHDAQHARKRNVTARMIHRV